MFRIFAFINFHTVTCNSRTERDCSGDRGKSEIVWKSIRYNIGNLEKLAKTTTMTTGTATSYLLRLGSEGQGQQSSSD